MPPSRTKKRNYIRKVRDVQQESTADVEPRRPSRAPQIPINFFDQSLSLAFGMNGNSNMDRDFRIWPTAVVESCWFGPCPCLFEGFYGCISTSQGQRKCQTPLSFFSFNSTTEISRYDFFPWRVLRNITDFLIFMHLWPAYPLLHMSPYLLCESMSSNYLNFRMNFGHVLLRAPNSSLFIIITLSPCQ